MKKLLVGLLVVAMAVSLAACGKTETPTPGSSAGTEVSAGTEQAEDMVYTFAEEAMGGEFTVNWTLTLKADGTFTLLEANPVMGDTTYTGTEYELGEGTVKLGALSGGTPMAGFFNEDLTSEWTLNEDGTMVAVGYDPDAMPEIDGDGEGAPADADKPADSKPAEDDGDDAAAAEPSGPITKVSSTTTYSYTEVTGLGFDVKWKLTLNTDGTFKLVEENPIQGTTTYTGSSYSLDGSSLHTGPLSGGTPLASFFNGDLSCEWTVSGSSMSADNYSPSSFSGEPME